MQICLIFILGVTTSWTYSILNVPRDRRKNWVPPGLGHPIYPSLTQVSAWLGCAASRFLIEISAECLSKQIDDDSEGCISALLETRNANNAKMPLISTWSDFECNVR